MEVIIIRSKQREGGHVWERGPLDVGKETDIPVSGEPTFSTELAEMTSRDAADRRPQLSTLSVPALIVHGCDDPLFPSEGGSDLSRTIPGAWLLEVNGMGHDLPAELFHLYVGAVTANCARAMNPSTVWP